MVSHNSPSNESPTIIIDDDIEQQACRRKENLEAIITELKFSHNQVVQQKHCRSLYEARHLVDEQITFQSSPINFSTLECIAENIAGERSMKTFLDLARYIPADFQANRFHLRGE